MYESAPITCLELAAQCGDVHFDNVLIEAVVSPDRGEQLGFADHAFSMRGQVADQPAFGVCQIKLDARTRNPACVVVYHHVGDRDLAAAGTDPSQQRVDPGHQLRHRERFDDVVVGSLPEPAHPVGECITSGQHQHRGLACASHDVKQGETVPAGKHHIQDHQIGVEGAEHRLELVTVGGAADVESLRMQGGAHRHPDGLAVLDHHNPCCRHAEYSARRQYLDRSGELKPQLAFSYCRRLVTATAF